MHEKWGLLSPALPSRPTAKEGHGWQMANGRLHLDWAQRPNFGIAGDFLDFFQKPLAESRLFARLPRSVSRRREASRVSYRKPLTDNCSLYGWTTHSYSTQGL